MDTGMILEWVKARQGITSNVRDAYITAIIDGVIRELESIQGLVLDPGNQSHVMFVVDFAFWRYANRDSGVGNAVGYGGMMPRDLRMRLNNMVIHATPKGAAT